MVESSGQSVWCCSKPLDAGNRGIGLDGSCRAPPMVEAGHSCGSCFVCPADHGVASQDAVALAPPNGRIVGVGLDGVDFAPPTKERKLGWCCPGPLLWWQRLHWSRSCFVCRRRSWTRWVMTVLPRPRRWSKSRKSRLDGDCRRRLRSRNTGRKLRSCFRGLGDGAKTGKRSSSWSCSPNNLSPTSCDHCPTTPGATKFPLAPPMTWAAVCVRLQPQAACTFDLYSRAGVGRSYPKKFTPAVGRCAA